MKNKFADIQKINQTIVITLNQDLDHHCAEYVRKETDKMLDKNNIKYVIINFENIDFMDSSGIGVIMGRYKKVLSNKGKVLAVNMSESIMRIYRMSGLGRIIESFQSMKEAMDNCN